jgi:hypothetical protein
MIDSIVPKYPNKYYKPILRLRAATLFRGNTRLWFENLLGRLPIVPIYLPPFSCFVFLIPLLNSDL